MVSGILELFTIDKNMKNSTTKKGLTPTFFDPKIRPKTVEF